MPRWGLFVLFLVGLLAAAGATFLQTNPGYMDAYYYYYGGQQIASGHGWNEMFIWNYLDDPTSLPHPAFTYWMPLTSLLAAVGIKLFSGVFPMFKAAQYSFVLLTACIAPVTASLAFNLSGRKGFGWLAGFLVIFCGFYLPYMTTTDSFSVVMLLGGLFFLLYARLKKGRALVFGLLAGLMHMARADGLLWLGVAGLAVLFDLAEENGELNFKNVLGSAISWRYLREGLIVVLGYLLVMFPWFYRNIGEFGGLFPPGGSRTMWVLSYDELFSYPASILTPSRWWDAGLGKLLAARGEAVWVNLQTTIISMGVLLPGILSILGLWHLRKNKLVKLGFIGWAVLFGIMTVVFPFSGMRGSYFHSGAALVPLMMALAPVGIDVLTQASLKRFKNWKDERIRPFYIGVTILFVIGFSVFQYFSTVAGFEGDSGLAWNQTETRYKAVDVVLDGLGASRFELVMAASPPGFTVVTGRAAIAIPDGDPQRMLEAAKDYGADWVLVEPNHPEGLDELYENPQDVGSLTLIVRVEDVLIFAWEGD